MIKIIKLLLLFLKWLFFIAALPLVGLFVLSSFLGVLSVLAGHGEAEDWLGVFASLFILSVTVVVMGCHLFRSCLGGERE